MLDNPTLWVLGEVVDVHGIRVHVQRTRLLLSVRSENEVTHGGGALQLHFNCVLFFWSVRNLAYRTCQMYNLFV